MLTTYLDINAISKTLNALSVLTELKLSLFDDRKRALITPPCDDPLLAEIKKSSLGKRLYNEFFDLHFSFAVKRRTPFFVKGPTRQYHVFIPLQYRDLTLVAVAEACYLQTEDFESFYTEHAREFGLPATDLHTWLKKITILPRKRILPLSKEIQRLLEVTLASCFEKEELTRRWHWAKTIITLATNIKTEAPLREIFTEVLNSVLFLFDADTVAVFAQQNSHYSVEIAGGRKSNLLQEFTLPENNHYVSKACQRKEPVSVMDSYELFRLGLPEEILSMYLFPIYSNSRIFALLAVFNTLLDRDAIQSIQHLCQLTAYLCNVRCVGQMQKKQLELINLVSLKVANLYFLYRDSHKLYQGIVNEAASLVDAEKCSLLLPSEDDSTLKVSAVKGINPYLMYDIKVKKGEGIAGKAFEEATPVLITNEESMKKFGVAPKSIFRTHSCVSIPLKIADEVVGILNLADKYSGEPFTEDDLATLNHFALQTSVLIKLSNCYAVSEQMRELSITDPLTGLYNRRYFNVRLNEEYLRSKRYNLPFSLAIVDIDDFKLFNDTEGHPAGDLVLKEIASIMNSSIRANDILVRFGGEEFAIIMPQTSSDEAFKVAERVRTNIKELIPPTWQRFPREHLTVSIGIAMYPLCGDPLENLIRTADRALYKAKVEGKDRTVTL